MASKAEKDKVLRQAYEACFASEPGKAVLLDLMIRFGYNRPVVVPGDHQQTCEGAGQLSVVQFIVRIIAENRMPDWAVEQQVRMEQQAREARIGD